MDDLDGTSACRDWRNSQKHSPERVVECGLGKILEEERCSVDFSHIEPVRHIYPHEQINNAPSQVIIRRDTPVMAHGVRHVSVTSHGPRKSKTELTTNDLVRDHHEKKASHTGNRTSNVLTRVVQHTSPEVREIHHESLRVSHGKPSNFRV